MHIVLSIAIKECKDGVGAKKGIYPTKTKM